MLLAEDLLLLLLGDGSGRPPRGTRVDVLLGGAVLSELALRGDVRYGEKARFGSFAMGPKVHPNPAAAPADPVLVHALGLAAEKEQSRAELVTKLSTGLREQLCRRLATAQLLRRENRRALGILPRIEWTVVDAAREREIRQSLAATLVYGVAAEPRTAALIALLHAVGRVHHYAPSNAVSASEVRSRAEEIAEGDWPAKAVSELTTVYAQTTRAASRFLSFFGQSAANANYVS